VILRALILGLALIGGPAAGADLVPYVVRDGAIDAPLAGTEPGDPARGLALVSDMNNVSCLICHVLPIADEPDMGEIGPPLDGIASRTGAGELRLRLVDSKQIFPDTMMPSYYVVDGLVGVDAPYAGTPIYSAQQIEDVLAYLLTLEEM